MPSFLSFYCPLWTYFTTFFVVFLLLNRSWEPTLTELIFARSDSRVWSNFEDFAKKKEKKRWKRSFQIFRKNLFLRMVNFFSSFFSKIKCVRMENKYWENNNFWNRTCIFTLIKLRLYWLIKSILHRYTENVAISIFIFVFRLFIIPINDGSDSLVLCQAHHSWKPNLFI